MFIRIIFVTLLALSILSLVGCADTPEMLPEAYGRIVKELPPLEEANKPFDFPYAEPGAHDNCVFKDDDFF